MPESLRNTPLVRMVKDMRRSMDNLNARFPGNARGPTRAKIVDVEDPEKRGRVRVVFDAMNPEDIPQFLGAGEYSLSRDGKACLSHWLDVSPPFNGCQPPGLIGKRANVVLSNNQYPYAVLQDVLYDPESLTEEAAEKLEIPDNSTMTRLPVYPAGQLPDPVTFNIGCMVVEEGGPMNSDWLCVCLKRDGKSIWVRHGDLAHGHAGGNDITSQVGADGVRPGNGQVSFIWDNTIVTSQQEANKWSGFGTFPRGNPFGDFARWYPPPMGKDGDGNKIEPLPVKPPELFDQNKALSFVRETGYIDDITGEFTSSFAPDIPAAVSSIPGYNFAQSLIDKGQKALKIAQETGKIIENPDKYAKEVAVSVADYYVTEQSKAAVSAGDGNGIIATVYSSLRKALGILSA